MSFILGIETSCDETAAAVFDTKKQQILSSCLFSQIPLHQLYGGVMPEVASRSHVDKIDVIVQEALDRAGVSLNDIDTIAVTQNPGLVGSLLVGICFAKSLAWASGKKIIGVNHNEGHIYSSLLDNDGTIRSGTVFPHIAISVSGGHSSMFLVHSTDRYELLGQTLDDAAGEAFDKIAKLLGLGYPGGPIIEKMAAKAGFKDYFSFPRTKDKTSCNFSFSGLKTAVLYRLVGMGVCNIKTGVIPGKMTDELAQQVSSSLLVAITDIFKIKINAALAQYPDIRGVALVGGVACNKYIRQELGDMCAQSGRAFWAPPPKFCTDNGAMIAVAGSFKAKRDEFAGLDLDVIRSGY